MSSETMRLTSSLLLSIGLLLYNFSVSLAYWTSSSVLIHYPHLCQAFRDESGHYYPGFFCPRLSDAPEEGYCCHLEASGSSCCTQAEFEALNKVNLSALPPPPILRGPGPLVALGLYSLLLVVLMTTDLLHFCCGRGRRGQAPRKARRHTPPRGARRKPAEETRPSARPRTLPERAGWSRRGRRARSAT